MVEAIQYMRNSSYVNYTNETRNMELWVGMVAGNLNHEIKDSPHQLCYAHPKGEDRESYIIQYPCDTPRFGRYLILLKQLGTGHIKYTWRLSELQVYVKPEASNN